jgi:hypothetical protein
MLTVNSFWFLVVSCGALLAACAQPQPGPTATAAVAQFGPAVAATNTTGPPTATSTPPPLPTPTPTIPHLYVIGAHITLGGWSPDSRWLAYWLAGDDDLRGLDAYDAPGGTLHLLNSRSKESCALPQFHATTWGRYSLAWENGDSLVVQDWENNEQRRGQLCRPAPLPAWENRRCRTKRPQMWACRPTAVSRQRRNSTTSTRRRPGARLALSGQMDRMPFPSVFFSSEIDWRREANAWPRSHSGQSRAGR